MLACQCVQITDIFHILHSRSLDGWRHLVIQEPRNKQKKATFQEQKLKSSDNPNGIHRGIYFYVVWEDKRVTTALSLTCKPSKGVAALY